MFQLGKTIVSEDILSKDFVCNLTACKGACCNGDASTTKSGRNNNFKRNISKVKPFLRKQGIAIEAQGTSVVGTW
jgi:hypothetical protein